MSIGNLPYSLSIVCAAAIDPGGRFGYSVACRGRQENRRDIHWSICKMCTHAPPHAAPTPGIPAFAVERTLGRLGKWLRLLGFDAVLEAECLQGGFMGHCNTDRILLTRTRRVIEAHSGVHRVFIRANDPFEQLVEAARAVGLKASDIQPFSRCLRCNVPIEALAREAARSAVPDYVWDTQPSFSRCPRCRRVYWRGTHITCSLKRIEMLLDGTR
jgi:hypothetical protein